MRGGGGGENNSSSHTRIRGNGGEKRVDSSQRHRENIEREREKRKLAWIEDIPIDICVGIFVFMCMFSLCVPSPLCPSAMSTSCVRVGRETSSLAAVPHIQTIRPQSHPLSLSLSLLLSYFFRIFFSTFSLSLLFFLHSFRMSIEPPNSSKH